MALDRFLRLDAVTFYRVCDKYPYWMENGIVFFLNFNSVVK